MDGITGGKSTTLNRLVFGSAVAGLSLILLILIFGSIVKVKQQVLVEGRASAITFNNVGPIVMGEEGLSSGLTWLIVPVKGLSTAGTVLHLTLDDTDGTKLRLSPVESDHIAVFGLPDSRPLTMRIADGARVTVRGGGEALWREELAKQLQFTSPSYGIDVIFEESPDSLLWNFDLQLPVESPEDSSDVARMTGGRIWGYGPDKVSGRVVRAIQGSFFARDDWEIRMPPVFTPMVGYSITIWKNENKVEMDCRPRLRLVLADSLGLSSGVQFIASDVVIRDMSGTVQVGAQKKFEYAGGTTVETGPESMTLVLGVHKGAVSLTLDGKVSSVRINGEQQVATWLGTLTRDYGVLVSVVAAMVAALFGAVIATKGAVLRNWSTRPASSGVTKAEDDGNDEAV